MRRGASAVELLICSAIMAAAFLPIYTLIQSNQRIAFLSENQIVARHIAYRALAEADGYLWSQFQSHATGPAPPSDVPMLAPEGNRLDFDLPSGEEEQELSETPGRMFASYRRMRDSMQLDVYFAELEPGFGRLSAVVRWKHPTNGDPRSFVAVSFVDAPFHQWVSR